MWSHVTLVLKIRFQSHSCRLSIAVSKLLLSPRVVKHKYFNKIFLGQQPRQVFYSPLNHLTPLLAREYLIEFSRYKTLNYINVSFTIKSSNCRTDCCTTHGTSFVSQFIAYHTRVLHRLQGNTMRRASLRDDYIIPALLWPDTAVLHAALGQK
jgi:hypothetical protein